MLKMTCRMTAVVIHESMAHTADNAGPSATPLPMDAQGNRSGTDDGGCFSHSTAGSGEIVSQWALTVIN
jgi:hypothetical protein